MAIANFVNDMNALIDMLDRAQIDRTVEARFEPGTSAIREVAVVVHGFEFLFDRENRLAGVRLNRPEQA